MGMAQRKASILIQMTAAPVLLHCPKCKGLMPADVSRCLRCGFELPPPTIHEIKDSSDASQASARNPVSTQLNWGTIWAQQVKKRHSNGWRIFLIIYLAGVVYFAIKTPMASSLLQLAGIAFFWFVFALPIAYVMTFIWSIWKAVVAYKESTSGALLEAAARNIRQLSWTKFFAVVLTSKLFFLASCTGGMVLGQSALDSAEGGTNIARGRPLDTRMSVIAVIPSAGHPGDRRVVQIALESLERFKQDNPNYSFVPPLGEGKLQDHSSYALTAYTVTAAGPGKVMVETRFHHDEHNVQAKYEATDREVKPLYTKSSHDMVNFMAGMFVGIPLAAMFALIGYAFKWRLRRLMRVNQSIG
jgi:hypothetical protein